MFYEKKTTDATVVIAEGACVVGDVHLGEGVNVWYNAVIRADEGPIVIGEGTNVQDCAVLHNQVTIGKGCTIGHTAIVHGYTLGDNVLVGMGAVILTGAQIGDDCIIGAGALVTGKTVVPAGSLVLGSPAKVVRLLTEQEIQDNRHNAQEYLKHAERYRRDQENRN